MPRFFGTLNNRTGGPQIIVMKKTKLTEAQRGGSIHRFALRQADTGTVVAEGCRKMGINEATFYN